MPTLSEQALAQVKPSAFRIGAELVYVDGKLRAEGGASYNRNWATLWGVTAYAKAYWNDKPIVPTDKAGAVIGFDIERKF